MNVNANVLYLDEDMVSSVLFGQMDQGTVHSLANINNQLAFYNPTSVIVQQGIQAFNSAVAIDNSWALRQAQAVIQNQQFVNVIVPLQLVSEIQNASSLMQYWVNIHPTVYNRVDQGVYRGYDQELLSRGDRHDQWVNVIDGYLLPVTDSGRVIYDLYGNTTDNEYQFYANLFKDEEQNHLNENDRRAILETWLAVDYHTQQGIDITNPELEALG
jgi:hypothetical protein